MTTPTDGVAALLERAASPGFDAWRRAVERLNGCTNPIHLIGSADLVDTATGEVLRSIDPGTYGGRLLVACGNRRARVCPTCARTYRADTYHLIRAGLIGTAAPGAVGHHPSAFVTLTAPGFGHVHTRREHDGRVRVCRPTRSAVNCPHGLPLGCGEQHAADDPRLGEPLCPHCYDYAGVVLWQAHAGRLWHRFVLELRREIAHRAGVDRTRLGEAARLSYAKVAEYQRRGLIHFHAVLRLDGPDGPDFAPPHWATTQLLADAVPVAVGRVRLIAGSESVVGRRVLRFGTQTDVRPITDDDQGTLTPGAVAGYIAKYATKGAEQAGAVDGRIRHARELVLLPVRHHVLRMAATCWWLGALPGLESLGLRRWAHMLGYGGHFSTKSRRYSTTLTALRQARTDHRAAERLAALGLDPATVATVGDWRYAGRGYTPDAALLAASAQGGGADHGA
jgi:hypothetical protein